MDAKTPWHLWLVGLLSLLWNSFGAYDYLMTQTKNEAYMAAFAQTQLDYFYGLPFWAVCAWAIAIWFGVLGSILLLLRKKLSVLAFLVSIFGVVFTNIYNYGLSNGYEVLGGNGAVAFAGVIFVIAVALYFYARFMTKKGVLN